MLSLQHVSAQQRPVLHLEFGGGYNSAKNVAADELGIMKFDSKSASPTLLGKIGYIASNHSVVGLSYTWSKSKSESEQLIALYDNQTHNLAQTKTKTNFYGVFYRYYFKALNTSRWNAYVEFNPSYTQSTERTSSISYTYNTMDSVTQSEFTLKSKAIHLDLQAGISYRFIGGLSGQLALQSLAYGLVPINKDDENVPSSFGLFEDPLKNARISLVYQF